MNIKVQVKSIAVSSCIELYKGGEKTSHFVSMTLEAEPGLSIEEFRIAQLEAGLEVAVAAIQNAVLRQALSEDAARERVKELKENYHGMIARISAKS